MSAVEAPAKVNLRLKVHEREASGYHRIETVFCALDLTDQVEVELDDREGVRLQVDGPDLGPAADNLAVRAAAAFLERAGLDRGVRISLRKRIPAGGGLGGGSSDAAAVLRALARLAPDACDDRALHDIAGALGSDVPFFLHGASLTAATGRGDVLQTLAPLPPRPILLVMPPFPVSTAEAYGWLDDDREAGGTPAPAHAPGVSHPGSWDDVARQACNDFEAPVFRRHPELRAVRDTLLDAGALVALLSGSGSTVFGVFPREDEARAAIRQVRATAPAMALRLTTTRG